MALRMATSLRMQATRMTLFFFPAARRRSANGLITGLQRIALKAHMYSARRTLDRPPPMQRVPLNLPESWSNGATPARAPT